jgi:EAL domain-containing protein (putative c-di-GMP-specific phosphodiesterase class I)
MGLVSPIGRFVLRTAMQQIADWQRADLLDGQVELSVNLSPHQLYRPELVDDIVDSLFTTGFDPRQLTLELTETALMHDTNAVRQRLLELREFGIRIALDDFGTGYSSLSYLRHFPIDVLKIDKSFIGAIGTGSDGASLSKAIIDLGRTLNLTTIAEGVESAEQAEELLRLQCRLGQGYYFSKPLPVAAMERYLADARALDEGPVTLTAIDASAIAL